MNDRIQAGDLVIVSFPVGDKTNNPSKKLNGQQFVVKLIHRVAENKNAKVTRVYYELFGAVSRKGIPYAFLEEQLIKL